MFQVYGSYEVYDIGSLNHSSSASVPGTQNHTAAALSEDTPILSEVDNKSRVWQRSDHHYIVDFMKKRQNLVLEAKLKEIFNSVKTQTAKENILLSLRLVMTCV